MRRELVEEGLEGEAVGSATTVAPDEDREFQAGGDGFGLVERVPGEGCVGEVAGGGIGAGAAGLTAVRDSDWVGSWGKDLPLGLSRLAEWEMRWLRWPALAWQRRAW